MPALLVGAAGLALALPAMAQLSEVEPNETKAQALTNGTFVMPLADGAALTGTTTGTSTTVPGLASADTWLVRPQARPAGIWRHRLIITTTGTAGHVGTIRGLNQSSVGVIGTTDNAAQTSATGTVPARFNQWYNFGGQEDLIYYRVTGGSTTTAPYVVNYEVSAVTPTVITNLISAGNVQIFDTGTIDADFWVYDASFNPIPGFGNDSPEATGVTRSMTPGTYYLALSRFNGANSLPSAAPETFAGTVLDFPGSWVGGGSTATTATAIPNFTSAAGTVVGPTANLANYEVAWYQFTVTAPTTPLVNSVVATPSTGFVGQTFLVVANVSTAPDLVPISTVSLDASQVDASTVALNDSGIAPDVTAGDGNWSGNVTIGAAATLGAKTLIATATDASARTATGNANFTVVAQPPANDNCASATLVSNAGPYPFNTAFNNTAGTVDGTWTGCSPFAPTGPDGWFRWTAPSDGEVIVSTCNVDTGFAGTQPDTLLGITSACGSAFAICEDDDASCGLGTKISLNVSAGTEYFISVRSYSTATANISGNFNLNFIPGTPFAITATSTSNSTIFTNGAPSSTIVTATVQNASLPPSTGVTVSLNAAAAGLGSINLLDNGVAPDAIGGDNVYTASISSTGATLGAYTFAVTATDAQARTAGGTIAQTIDSLDETGELVATANLAPDASTFNGRLNTGTDVDMWKIFICDPAAFSATTVGGLTVPGTATGSDTALFLFSPDGNGISYNDDVTGTNFNSLLANTQVASLSAGEYYLAVAYFGNRPTNASAQTIWSELAPTTTVPPTGLGAPGPVADWNGLGTTVANYTLTLTGVSLTACGPTCNDIDINNDGASFDPTDIDAFLSVYGEGPCIPDTATCDGIDFNNDGSLFDPCDIDSFLLVFSEGPCTLCGV
jgi:hypothetical protein